MNANLIREVESLYNATQDFLSDGGLKEKQDRPCLNRTEYQNPFPKDAERYLKKDQLLSMFKSL